VVHHKQLHAVRVKSKHSELLVYFFSLTTPLFMLPQLYEIYHSHSALHVALATWAYFLVADVVWTLYGIKHRLLPLIVGHALYFVIESAIVIGILIYR
jgi:uncharacterized protein with PQ loop repeat